MSEQVKYGHPDDNPNFGRINEQISDVVRRRLAEQMQRSEVLALRVFGDFANAKREALHSPLNWCYEQGEPGRDPTLRMTMICLRCHRDYVGQPITTADELAEAKETYASGFCMTCTKWREQTGVRL